MIFFFIKYENLITLLVLINFVKVWYNYKEMRNNDTRGFVYFLYLYSQQCSVKKSSVKHTIVFLLWRSFSLFVFNDNFVK